MPCGIFWEMSSARDFHTMECTVKFILFLTILQRDIYLLLGAFQLGLAFQIFDNVIEQHTSSWIELSNVNTTVGHVTYSLGP